MNRQEWIGISQWLAARWPHALTAETDEAYYVELEKYTTQTIRTAAEQLLRSGRDFLTVSALVSACADVARMAHDWDTTPALPESSGVPWSESGVGEPGESFVEYALKDN